MTEFLKMQARVDELKSWVTGNMMQHDGKTEAVLAMSERLSTARNRGGKIGLSDPRGWPRGMPTLGPCTRKNGANPRSKQIPGAHRVYSVRDPSG